MYCPPLVDLNEVELTMEEDQDVTVIVGGKELRESGHFLRYLCGYFDGACRTGMRESTTDSFSFPDRDPDEWELFVSVFKPASPVRIGVKNDTIVLKWCDLLCVKEEHMACLDETYLQVVFKELQRSVHSLEISFQYDLEKTKENLHVIFVALFATFPSRFDVQHLACIMGVVRRFGEDVPQSLWKAASAYIPEDLLSQDSVVLLTNDLLPHLIHATIQLKNR